MKHCTYIKHWNGSQIFDLGASITLEVLLGPPCRLVCKRLIENSVWLQTTYIWQIAPSRGVTVHFQILLLHLCSRNVCVRGDYRSFGLEKCTPPN